MEIFRTCGGIDINGRRPLWAGSVFVIIWYVAQENKA